MVRKTNKGTSNGRKLNMNGTVQETPVIRKDSAEGQSMKGAVAFGEFALGGDGLALALLFGGNTEIKGDGHAHPCVTPWDRKGNR